MCTAPPFAGALFFNDDVRIIAAANWFPHRCHRAGNQNVRYLNCKRIATGTNAVCDVLI